MPMATRAGSKRAASAESDREGDQHIVVRSELSEENLIVWNLTPGRHTPGELVHATRNFFDLGTGQTITEVVMAPFQQPLVTRKPRLEIALIDFEDAITVTFPEGNISPDACVEDVFRIFDQYFFFDQVHEYAEVELVQGLSRQNMWGCTMDDPFRGYPYQLIKLDTRGVESAALDKARDESLKAIFGTLLHEMVHCMFRIFKCACPQCKHDHEYMLGARGHGFCWIELANAVQRVAREQFDSDLDLHCGEDGLNVRGFRAGLNKRRRIGS